MSVDDHEEVISAGASEAGVTAVTQRGAIVSLSLLATPTGDAALRKEHEAWDREAEEGGA